MRKPIIGIDVDLTVVDSLQPWFNYTGVDLKLANKPYSINGSYSNYIMENSNFPTITEQAMLQYWDLPNLYDNMEPLNGACEFIHELAKHANIVFISVCQPAHKRSKQVFLEKHFGDFPLIDTHDKYLVNVDLMIEDNLKVLHEFNLRRSAYGMNPAARVLTNASTKGHDTMLSGYELDFEYTVPLSDFNENARYVFDIIRLMTGWDKKYLESMVKIARLSSIGRISSKPAGYKPKIKSSELLTQ